RFLSLSLGLLVSIILIVYLASSFLIVEIINIVENRIAGYFVVAGYYVVFLLLVAFFIASVYRIMPDIEVSYKDVWEGSVFSAVLMTAGQILIGAYFNYGSVGLNYGGAGQIIVLLVWFYYTSIVF